MQLQIGWRHISVTLRHFTREEIAAYRDAMLEVFLLDQVDKMMTDG